MNIRMRSMLKVLSNSEKETFISVVYSSRMTKAIIEKKKFYRRSKNVLQAKIKIVGTEIMIGVCLTSLWQNNLKWTLSIVQSLLSRYLDESIPIWRDHLSMIFLSYMAWPHECIYWRIYISTLHCKRGFFSFSFFFFLLLVLSLLFSSHPLYDPKVFWK